VPRFPAAFQLPAFASRSSDSRRGIGPSLRSAYRAKGPDPDGVTTFHTHELRPGWEPPIPRGQRCSSRLKVILSRHLPLPSVQSLHPATTSHLAGPTFTRHHQRFTLFPRPVFPSPVAAGWNGTPSGFPPSSAPRRQNRTAHVGVGTGHRARAWNYALDISRPPIDSSLNACDIVSQ